MLKLTVAQLVEMAMPVPGRAKTPLRELLDAGLPGRVALAVARQARAIEEEWRAVEGVRFGLVKKHGKQGELPGRFEVPPEKLADFMAEWLQVLGEDIEIKRGRAVIPDAALDSLTISAGAMAALEPAFAFGEPEKK